MLLSAARLPGWFGSRDDLFTRVSPSVVVVRAKGRDVTAAGVTRFNETGSGVLISSDGRVMTAAHVVNGMDEITVEGIGGEVVRATIISANAAADVSLLQLERVTRAMRVAQIGDSGTMRVGQQVMIVGAPYGLAYSTKSGGSEGLGFIVTINSAHKLLVPRKVFWGALQGVLLTGRLATVFNVPARRIPGQDGGPTRWPRGRPAPRSR